MKKFEFNPSQFKNSSLPSSGVSLKDEQKIIVNKDLMNNSIVKQSQNSIMSASDARNEVSQ